MGTLPDRVVQTFSRPQLSVVTEQNRAEAAEDSELHRLLAAAEIRSAYQPVVELDTGRVVGYEALARPPAGSGLARPDLLFAAARRAGRLAELDLACQHAALDGAREGGLPAQATLFINVEPGSASTTMLDPPSTDAKDDAGGGRHGDFQIIVELTERSLVDDPIELLALVGRIRARGWGIALDDLGSDPNSLALLPLLQPDVIKLDLRLVQQRATTEIAHIVSAVNAEAERSGSAILAEGIETEEHLNVALAMGASLGQGWLLGRPEPLPDPLPDFGTSPLVVNCDGGLVPTKGPFALGSAKRPTRLSRKELLIEISKHLEAQAMASGESTVVLSTFQDASFFTAATKRRYTRLAQKAAFVGALGLNMPQVPLSGVRGCALEPDDPLIGEWDIAVVGPHYAAALVARDLGDTGPDLERRFEFVLSHDREVVVPIALALMARVWSTDSAPAH